MVYTTPHGLLCSRLDFLTVRGALDEEFPMRNATNTLLDEVRVILSITSDYALAKRLGVRQQAITNYRSGRTQMTEGIALRVAEILGRPPVVLFPQIGAERTKDQNVASI